MVSIAGGGQLPKSREYKTRALYRRDFGSEVLYHRTGTEGGDRIARVIDDTDEDVGSRHRYYLIFGAVVAVNQIR